MFFAFKPLTGRDTDRGPGPCDGPDPDLEGLDLEHENTQKKQKMYFALDPFFAFVFRADDSDTPKRCGQATDPHANLSTVIQVFTVYVFQIFLS